MRNNKHLKHEYMLKMHKFMFLASKSLDRLLNDDLNIGFSQCMILMFVDHHPRVSQRDISDFRDITPAAVSRHVETLVTKGYMFQQENVQNKREYILEVSDQGRELLDEALQRINDELDRICIHVSREEAALLDDLYNRLLSSIDDEQRQA